MSFGLSRGRTLDSGEFGIRAMNLPPLPDDCISNPEGARLDVRGWFDHPERPFELEIGSGKGTFLVQQSGHQPDTNFLGIEYAHEFYAYAADRMRRNQIENVRMLHADASEFLRWRVPTGIISVLHLYFPDPWPKSRHHKRRMMQDAFMTQVHRVLESSGELRVVTDHLDYWAWMEEHFARWCAPDHSPRFDRFEFARPESAGDGEVVGTNFERKYITEGRTFNGAILRRAD